MNRGPSNGAAAGRFSQHGGGRLPNTMALNGRGGPPPPSGRGGGPQMMMLMRGGAGGGRGPPPPNTNVMMMNGGGRVPQHQQHQGRGGVPPPLVNGRGRGGPQPPNNMMMRRQGRDGPMMQRPPLQGPPPPNHRMSGGLPSMQQQQQQQQQQHAMGQRLPQGRGLPGRGGGLVPPPPPPPRTAQRNGIQLVGSPHSHQQNNNNMMMQQRMNPQQQGRGGGMIPNDNRMYQHNNSGGLARPSSQPPLPPVAAGQRFPSHHRQQVVVGGHGSNLPPPPPPPPPPPQQQHFNSSTQNGMSTLAPPSAFSGSPYNNKMVASNQPIMVMQSATSSMDPRRQQQQNPLQAQQQFRSGYPFPNSATAGNSQGGGPAQQQQLPPPVGAGPAPAATTTAQQREQLDQAWIVFDPQNGSAKYYFNAVSKVSQYDMPESMLRRDAAISASVKPVAAVQQPSIVVPPRQQQLPPAPSQWVEYTDATSGKKYYSNGVATVWDKPAALGGTTSESAVATTTTTTTTAATATSATADETSSEPPKKKKKVANRETKFGSKEEAVAAFKGLMLAKEILPTMKWNDVVKLCKSDSRWQACEDVLTTGERKQSLAEYQTKRANELRTIERQEKARAKEAFIALLSDKLPTVANFSAWTSRFGDVRDSLSKDDRFHAVATEATRESLFLDFCEEFKKREERKKRNKKREAKDAFVAFLKEKEEEGTLSFASTWNSFLSSLSDDDKSDSRFTTSAVMTDSDRQLYFADTVIELQALEDDKRNRIRGARRRAEKAQREAFQEALHGLAADGIITPFSKWRTSEDKIAALDSFGPVQDQDRDAPREIFEDFLAEWNESYGRDRAILSQLVYPKNINKQIVVTPDTLYDVFTKALLEAAVDYPDLGNKARRIISRSEPISSARIYLQELISDSKGLKASVIARRGSSSRRLQDNDSSSEDEGEIVEDGEEKLEEKVEDDGKKEGEDDHENKNDVS